MRRGKEGSAQVGPEKVPQLQLASLIMNVRSSEGLMDANALQLLLFGNKRGWIEYRGFLIICITQPGPLLLLQLERKIKLRGGKCITATAAA